jgi:hypothetical protein
MIMRTPPFVAAFSFFIVAELQTANEFSLGLHYRVDATIRHRKSSAWALDFHRWVQIRHLTCDVKENLKAKTTEWQKRK